MLKRVSIQNFKSLKDVTLDLQKVNLLIGPNNSGKTNFLKALQYMIKDNTNQEDTSYDRILFQKSKEKIQIELTYESETEYGVDDWFVCIVTENRIIQKSKGRIDNQQKSYGTFLHFNPEVLKARVGPLIIYKPDPNKITQPGPVGTGEAIINSDASNLVGFLDRMLSNKYRKSVFNHIENDLHVCIPEFDEINLDDALPTEELKKQFGDKSFKRIGLTNSKQNVTYWADELSEGTLYFLALLCIVNQPNPPKLLLLEEPEKGIHPRRIREVMDFIFRLAEEKDVQIILTTHNEHVLDDFATRPEAVFVFDKDEEGATYVRNLQHDIIEPTNQRNRELGLDEVDLTTNLSENWLYGLLGGVPAIP